MRSRDARPRSYFPLWTLEPPRSLGKRVPPLLSFASPGGVRNRDRVTALALVGSPAPRALGAAPVSPGASRLPESDNGSSRVAGGAERVPACICQARCASGQRLARGPQFRGVALDRIPAPGWTERPRFWSTGGSLWGEGAPPSERSKTAEPARTLCEDLTVL